MRIKKFSQLIDFTESVSVFYFSFTIRLSTFEGLFLYVWKIYRNKDVNKNYICRSTQRKLCSVERLQSKKVQVCSNAGQEGELLRLTGLMPTLSPIEYLLEPHMRSNKEERARERSEKVNKRTHSLAFGLRENQRYMNFR